MFDRKAQERDRIQRRIADNVEKDCSCKGCGKARHKMAPYCATHYNRYRRHGSPNGRIPTRRELRILDDVILGWIDEGLKTDTQKESFQKLWGSGVVKLRKPRSKAKGLWFLSGDTGLTQYERADIVIANYQHRKSKPLGMALLRWMSCRLWAELLFEMPPGKRGFGKERTKFVNLFAGQYVTGQAGVTQTMVESVTVGYQRSPFAANVGELRKTIPIVEKWPKTKRLSASKSANVNRAIGIQLAVGVGHIFGPIWHSDMNLLERADTALRAMQTPVDRGII